MSANTLIEVIDLKKYFPIRSGIRKKLLKAVDGVSFRIRRGETFGIVGESGCGKSSLGRTITRLYDSTEGRIIFDGVDITHLRGSALRSYRKKMQIVFQDPYSSLNPGMTAAEILGEPLKIHSRLKGPEHRERIEELLHIVGLGKADMEKFPHEFSGGQRQRIGVARAISVRPDFVLCDEPISALDVSIRAQIVNTLVSLQRELNLSYLFIAHDLSMVRYISHRIGVMYLGKLVEVADSTDLYRTPLHPYTAALLESVPRIGEELNFKAPLSGEVSSPVDPPRGCRFQFRCPHATDVCREMEPPLKEQAPGHWAACHLHESR